MWRHAIACLVAALTVARPACANGARSCDDAVAALRASGEAECTTYCPTSILCTANVGHCALPNYYCWGRWAWCGYDGRLVVATTGLACDSGPWRDSATTDASLDAGVDM